MTDRIDAMKTLRCIQCGYVWMSKMSVPPVRCPLCMSPHWNDPNWVRYGKKAAVKAKPVQAQKQEPKVEKTATGSFEELKKRLGKRK